MCPFCGAEILDPQRPESPTAAVARSAGPAGVVAAALLELSGPPPAPGPPRDPALNGDVDALVRTPDTHELERPHPVHVVWELTLKCDLACGHCGSRAGRARGNELTTEECFDVIDQMADLGVREVTLIGGEAYLRSDWARVAAGIVDRGMQCTMTTGARQLTEERVRAAEQAGLASIGISIDGLELTHDAQRGVRGSWRAAVDAAERVSASRVRLTTNTQLNALSAPEVPALARLLDDIGSAAWQVQLTVAMGRAADRPGLFLQPAELIELFPLLVWTKEYLLDPSGIALIPGNNIGYFGIFERYLRYGGERGAHWTSCAAGRWVLGLEADGQVKGCPSLPTASYAGGNVRQQPLRSIVESSGELTHIGQRSRDDLWGFCRDCYYSDVCLAGCTWTTHSFLGRPGNNPYCIHRALTLAERGISERLVQIARAPGVPFDTGLFALCEAPAVPVRPGTLFGVPLQAIVSAGPRAGSVRGPSSLSLHMSSSSPLLALR